MPRSATTPASSIWCCRPNAIGEALCGAHPRARRPAQSACPTRRPGVMDAIFSLLRDESGIDFSRYKANTVGRRIQRRLLLTHSGDLDEYVDRLAQDPDELHSLYKDLLIGVTRFFRDAEAFERSGARGAARACSTRSETTTSCASGSPAAPPARRPYWLAMLFAEAFERAQRPATFKIFATDVHSASLERASAGVYADEQRRARSAAQRLRALLPTAVATATRSRPSCGSTMVFAHHNVHARTRRSRRSISSRAATCSSTVAAHAAQGAVLVPLRAEGRRHAVARPERIAGRRSATSSRSSTDTGRCTASCATSGLPEIRGCRCAWSRDRRRRAGLPRTGAVGRPLLVELYDELLDEYMPPSLLVDETCALVAHFGGAEPALKVRRGGRRRTCSTWSTASCARSLAGAMQRAQRDRTPVRLDGVTRQRRPKGRRQRARRGPSRRSAHGNHDDAWSSAWSRAPMPEHGTLARSRARQRRSIAAS